MPISLKNFVDVSLIHHKTSVVNAIRDTAALLTTETFTDTAGTNLFTSYEDFKKRVTTYGSLDVTDYVDAFFKNGGGKLYISAGVTDTVEGLTTAINALPNEYIIIVSTGTQSNMITIADNLVQVDENNDVIYDIDSKIICVYVTDVSDLSSYHRLAAKYVVTNYEYDVMTIPAYLTKTNVYGTNTVQDYNFTIENVDSHNVISDNTLFVNCSDNDINVEVRLANANRNIGGNCTDGQDLVNDFMFIVLHQTLTESIISALTSKVKGNIGLSVIKTAMTAELQRYVTNGYLATDKIWKYDDLIVNYNNESYVVIAKDTPLIKGYSITILPYYSLTPDDISIHSTPPIYVVIATSYGIRKVVVRGDEF